MNKILSILAALAIAVFMCSSCEDPNATEPVDQETIELLLSVPAKIECAAGDVISINFYSGKGPKSGDVVLLRKNTVEFICPIVSLESDNFSFELPKVMASNTYSFCIKRGETVKVVRDVEFVVEQRQELEQKEGYNVYGMVLDIGEDHDDDYWEYYGTANYDEYRQEQIDFLQSEIDNKKSLDYEYKMQLKNRE